MTYQNPTYCQNLSVAFSHNTFFGETQKNENSRKLRLDYYLFGMPMPSRTFTGNGYRYSFNGKENITEVFGWQDYGERFYNTNIARFFSPDPIIVYGQRYPNLSSYQFASNSPVQNVDIDGLEGESYLEVKIETNENGEKVETVLRRVIEIDIFLAISEDVNSKQGYYAGKNLKKADKVARRLQKEFHDKYNSSEHVDENGHPVVFKFNIYTFNIDEKTPEDIIKNDIHINHLINGGEGVKAFVLKLGEIDNKNTQGYYQGLIATVSVNARDREHTQAHEGGHFILIQNPSDDYSNMVTEEQHSKAGGIFNHVKYTDNIYKNSDGTTTTIESSVGKKDVTQENVNQFLRSVVKTQNRTVTE
jgi:RHS repeat-associated protein